MSTMPNNPVDADDFVVGGDGDGVQSMDTTIFLASNHTYLTMTVLFFCLMHNKLIH